MLLILSNLAHDWLVIRRAWVLTASVSLAAGVWLGAAPQKKAPATVERPAFSGLWELTDAAAVGGKITEHFEAVPGDGPTRPGTGATDGAGTGGPGARGGFVPPGATEPPANGHVPINYTSWGDKVGSIKPKRLSASEALFMELMTPPEEFVIGLSSDTVAIGTGIGAAITYAINNKTESHQLTNGSITTKTLWSGAALRQEIDGGRNLKLVRLFQLSIEGDALSVTVGSPSLVKDPHTRAAADGKGSTVEPRRTIYARKRF
jgi:hypothetical protein